MSPSHESFLGPLLLRTPGPRCSHAPLLQTHSLRQLRSWPSGLWDSGPANSSGKEGKEGTPQTNGELPEPKHTLVRGLSRQAGQGAGLTPSLPARLQGVPQVLINAIALPSGQMSLLFNHPSRLSWLGKKSLFLLLGQQIYSFIVTETGHRSGSSFCCLTCSHPLTWAAMAAADRCPLISSLHPQLSSRETGNGSRTTGAAEKVGAGSGGAETPFVSQGCCFALEAAQRSR